MTTTVRNLLDRKGFDFYCVQPDDTVEHAVRMLVEHNVDFVLGLAEHVTVLDFGKVIAAGTPAAIRDDEAVQAAYLGATTNAGAV